MKRLTPIKHAKAKGKTITMSMPDRGPELRARIIARLEKRPGDGWFYARGDNDYFGTPADATAFKLWLMRRTRSGEPAAQALPRSQDMKMLKMTPPEAEGCNRRACRPLPR